MNDFFVSVISSCKKGFKTQNLWKIVYLNMLIARLNYLKQL